MKYVSSLKVAALAFNTRKITLIFHDNVSNMTYSHFFEVWHWFKNFF